MPSIGRSAPASLLHFFFKTLAIGLTIFDRAVASLPMPVG